MRCNRGTIPWAVRTIVLTVTLTAVFVGVPTDSMAQRSERVPSSSDDPFARYTTPGECVRTGITRDRQFWRNRRPDTLSQPLSSSPLQSSTIDAVRRCVARFTVASVAPADLVSLGQAYLAANQDTLADAAFQRLLAEIPATDKPAHATALSQMVQVLSQARPVRIQEAQRYLAQLDQLDSISAPERMMAHRALASSAHILDSVALLQEATRAALAASRQITGDARKIWAPQIAEVYVARADVEGRVFRADSALAVLRDAQSDVGKLRPSTMRTLTNPAAQYGLMGKPAPSIHASSWLPGGHSAPVSWPPTVPTLVVFVDPVCGGMCYAGYSVLRRIQAKHMSGVNMLLVTRTQQFYRSELVDPDDEIRRTGEYFLSFLKLPATLAVWKTEFQQLRDGRYAPSALPNETAFQVGGAPLMGVLIGPNGGVRLTLSIVPVNEARLDRVLEEWRR